MTFLHSEMRYLLSTYLPNFDLACKAIEPCPDDLAVCHVTVVRLSANGFGRLFRYVSCLHFAPHPSPIVLNRNHSAQ